MKGWARALTSPFASKTVRRFMPFHAAGLRAGGRDHGAPGLRPHYGSNYYAAFILNPDGINVEAVCHAEVDLNAAENIS